MASTAVSLRGGLGRPFTPGFRFEVRSGSQIRSPGHGVFGRFSDIFAVGFGARGAASSSRRRLCVSFEVIPLVAVTEFGSAISIRVHRHCHGVAVGFSGEELQLEASRSQF